MPDASSAMLANLRALVYEHAPDREPHRPEPPRPFITLSREPGTDDQRLIDELLSRLRLRDPADPPWTVCDRQVVETIASELQIPKSFIESIERTAPSCFGEMVRTLTATGKTWPTDTTIYHRVAHTLRAMAEMGRVVLVGRGGAFASAGLPGGTHIRLVAPRSARVRRFAALHQLTEPQAADAVRRLERDQDAFFQRYWPKPSFEPSAFDAVFNTAAFTPEAIAGSILALVGFADAAAAARGATPRPTQEAQP